MERKYEVSRKLQEQSGSYFVILPKIWVKSCNLKQGDILTVKFDGGVEITPLKQQPERGRIANE
jgi:antitoxin component of MazEF toxin-antitoxin module